MKKSAVLFLIAAGIFLSGCASMRSVTQSLLIDIGVTEDEEIKKFQYYLSSNVVLTDAEPVRERKNTTSFDGSTAIRDTVTRNKIKISKNTPGVVLNSYLDDNNLLVLEVCFEDDDNKRLTFRQGDAGQEQRFYLVYSQPSKLLVDYGGDPYTVTRSSGERLSLRIGLYKEQREKIKTRRAKGRRVTAGML